MAARFKGLIAPVEVPTGDGRMFASGKLSHRPTPFPLLARFSSGGHDGATVVGKVNRIYQGPGGYWAEGEFLDPAQVPEVPKAIYMLQNKVMGPSVDLDRDFTVEVIKHPTRPDKKAGMFKEYNVIGITLVPMPAFSQVHLAVDSEDDKALLASVGIDASDWARFDVNHESWKSWPVAPRDYVYDADDAVKRIAYWAGIGSRQPNIGGYASTFLWRNGNQVGDSLAQDSFRLPLADIINNEPHLIYHAVYAAAALLSGAHGGLPNIPDHDKQAMVPVINEIYASLAQTFNDPNLTSPFNQQQAAIQSEDCGCSEMPDVTINISDGVLTTTSTGTSSEVTWAMDKTPYGKVAYADPGYQGDGVKRYPIDTEEHVRAAWAYINKASNAAQYTAEQLKEIKMRITKAMKKHGIDESGGGEDTNPADTSGDMAMMAGKKTPYGAKVMYADPGYQGDGVKRYPLDSRDHCIAAWRFINMPNNASKYTPEQLAMIKGKIQQALKKYGIDASSEDQSNQMALDYEGMEDDDPASLLASVAPLAPPVAWFSDPKLKSPTKLTITEDGQVFGHLAQWKVCHVGVGNSCVMAPHSRMGYSLFRQGAVVCEDGSEAPIGKITLGTGHANPTWGMMPSREHYDNTGWAAAVVNVGEDVHGIWVAGALTTTMTPQRIAELRAASLSGDWRVVNGNLELIAALAVNNPGFPIYREKAGHAFSLAAVGIIGLEEEFSMDEEFDTETEAEGDEDFATEYPADDETEDAAELAARIERWNAIEQDLEEYNQERRAAQLAALDEEREQMLERR